ncbi:MAG: PAS domain-containing protein [Arcobacteraceae bacterium]
MNIAKLKGISKLIIITFFIIVTLIGGVMTSLSILKEEAVNANIRMVKLQADTFSENLSQTINTLDLLFNSLSSFLELKPSSALLDEQFMTILKNNPHIRSINLLENNRVIVSSNANNINAIIPLNDFYPKPFFNQAILQVGTVFIGRDLDEINPNETAKKNRHNQPSFIPIIKKFQQNNKTYHMLVALNPDYFINLYASKLEPHTYIDILRLDDTVLASSQPEVVLCDKCEANAILLNSKEQNSASGVTFFHDEQYIIAYTLTKNYPFNLAVRTKYTESLKGWESKRYDFFIITTAIVIVCVILVMYLLFLYHAKHQEELKRHQLQIKNQKKFQILFENNHFLASIVDKEGKIVQINQKALTMLNRPCDEIIHTIFWNLFCFSPEDKRWLQEVILNYKKDQTIQKELYVVDGHDNAIIIEFTIVPIDNEEINELVLLGSDITQRKKNEYKIKEAYTVFQNTQDGIVITDKEARIINANKAFEKCSGYTKQEVIYKNPNILKSGLHDAAFYQRFWEKLSKEGFWEGELINKKKNGELWSEWLTINTVWDENGEVQNYIGVFHDTTAQKNHEKELRQKEDILMQQAKMASMGEMIENIAHQWRQPLSVISTIATGIQLKHEYGIFNEEEVLNDLKSINSSAQYLSHTIDDFRNFLTKTKVKKIFKLNLALEKALNILQSKFKNREIQIIKHIEDLECNGFENELIQVFLNLLSNSKDAFESNHIEEKYIFIDGYEEEGKILIFFKDSAGGIPLNIIDKVFEPYFTTKHQSQGTGIGLYMSKQIIHNHLEGELSVSNVMYEYNGKNHLGACFKIVLKA